MMTDDEAKDFYGATAEEWLKRWNEGRGVWSIEMGGLGPGYEQALQMCAARLIFWMVENKPDASGWADAEQWKAASERIEAWSHEDAELRALGLSGAQYGAALQIAARFYRDGPWAAIQSAPADRHIQVSKTFPGTVAA